MKSNSALIDRQLEQGRLYARTHAWARRLQFALDGIAAMRAIAPHAYLSLSWGKQSIVLAHMLYQVDPSIPSYFLASGESFIIHNFADVIESFTARWPIAHHIVMRDHVFDGEQRDWKASRDAGEHDLQTMCDRADWDGWYWGLAKEESKARRITLSYKWAGQPHPSIFKYSDGKYRCCPIMNWKMLDLAAYIAEYDLPLLDAYRVHGLGERTTARITRNAAELGGVATLRHKDVEAFNRLCERFPELRTRT